jgi:diadenosine tetraphosphatase ApaH/serine/threonine PP2A family protein phosphatase
MLMDCFDSLPLVCLVNNRYFNVHGGISDKIVKVIFFNLGILNR